MSKQIFGHKWIILLTKMVQKSDGTRVSRYGSWCLIFVCIDLNDLSILKFWFKIQFPDKSSNYLIGLTIYFYVKRQFSYSMPLIQKVNGGLTYENSIFPWKYTVWPIKWWKSLPGIWIMNQNFKIVIDRSLRSLYKYIRKRTHFNDFWKNFQAKIFLKGQY